MQQIIDVILAHLADIIALIAVLGLIFNKIQERDTALSVHISLV